MKGIILLLLIPFYGQSQLKVEDLITLYHYSNSPYKTRTVLERSGYPQFDTIGYNVRMFSILKEEKEYLYVYPRGKWANLFTTSRDQYCSWEGQIESLGFKRVYFGEGLAPTWQKGRFCLTIMEAQFEGDTYRLGYWLNH